MFTSINAFRPAHNRSAVVGRASRMAGVARRVGVATVAMAFVAALPSPASAAPGVTDPLGVQPTALTGALAQVGTETDTVGVLAEVANARKGTGDKHARKKKSPKRSKPAPSRGSRVMGVAAAQTGDPYVYGAAGPNAFDCSGLTSFVYRVAAGKSLPHSSSAQKGATQSISRAAARPGDLVFFHGSGGIYHVGIFAGGNSLIHASKPGTPVSRARIWTSAVSFGRVR